ncbi:SAV_2336 N-terminal domain-related protein [Actinomadura sp. 9N407]|uniref:SAV_2336 N-terminal domain-related protein n=1 Tax=Actinomadura sp. 9N407 TaxID=3375154 RepID=UPI0037A2FCA1
MITRLIEALRGLDPPPSVEELADALWLAGHLPPAGAGHGVPAEQEAGTGSAAVGQEARETGSAGTTDERPAPSTPAQEADRDVPSGERPQGEPEPAPQAGLYLADRNGTTSFPVRSPTLPAVPRALGLARVLRPLRMSVPSPTPGYLDEDETARRFADTGFWEPVLRPAVERRFELVLVVDDSASMALWRRTADELRLLLERLGAFRDVRVRYLDTDSENLVLRTGSAPATGTVRGTHDPGGPAHRRIVLVVSDCIGAAWQDGRAAALLERWGRSGSVAIVQPLPQRLWWRCGAAVELVRVSAPAPGAANSALTVRMRERGARVPPGVAVPVMELEERWLRPWASMIAGSGHEIAGAALFTGRPVAEGVAADVLPEVPVSDPPDAPAGEISPLAQVLRFRTSASPTAFELAGYLAAAPLRLPVMRLVQRSMLPRSTPAHLAEVFLGGLLRVAAEGGTPDEVAYEFHDGVRDVLLGGLRRDEALQVLRAVWDTIRDRIGSSLDFPALLAAVRQDTGVLPVDRPFAQVAAQVLTRLGGRYGEIAERITVAATRPGEGLPASGFRGTGNGRVPEARGDAPSLAGGGVPPRNRHFTGRGELMEAVEEELRGAVTVLLPPHASGPGPGCEGKTEIAVEYVHAHADEYDLVWWIPASDTASVRAALRDLARRLGTPVGDDMRVTAERVLRALPGLGRRMGTPGSGDMRLTADSVLRTLRDGVPLGRWLLVYDAACDPAELVPLMPAPAASGDVLVTSHDPRWEGTATAIEVGAFERPESVALLRRRVPRLLDAEADRLAALLGDLPPALDQAARWLAASGGDLGEYVRAFEERAEDGGAPHATAASLNLDRLREEQPVAAGMLDLWSFLGSAPVPAWLLGTDDAAIVAGMRCVSRYGAGRFDEDTDTLRVPAEIRALVRARLPADALGRLRDDVHALLAAATPDGGPDDPATWEARGLIRPHIVPSEIIDAGNAEGSGGADSGGAESRGIVLDQARFLCASGEFDGGRLLSQAAIARWQERYGPDDPLVAEAQRVLATALSALGPDQPSPLPAADGGGDELRLRGEFEAAYRFDSEIWRRMRQRYGDDDPNTLLAAADVGTDLCLLGKFHEAYAVDLDAFQRAQRRTPRSDAEVFRTRHHLARDLHGLGRYDEALRCQNAAFDELRASLPPDDALVLQARTQHAATLRKTGDVAEAVQLADESLHAHIAAFGPEHPATLAARMTAAMACTAAGDPGPGRVLAEEAWDGLRHTLGIDHPLTHACAAGLGIILRALGDVQTALETDQVAWTALCEHPGPEHYYTLCCTNGLANDLYLLGELDAAYELSAHTADDFRARHGPDHPYTLACDHNRDVIDRVANGSAGSGGGGDLLECDIELLPL